MIINPTITVIRSMNRQGHIRLKAKQEFWQYPKRMEIAIKTSQGYLYCCSDQDYFVETDNTGKMIKAFHPGYKTDRVVKNDFMDSGSIKMYKEELYSS